VEGIEEDEEGRGEELAIQEVYDEDDDEVDDEYE
jgi:hypothetical protein